VINSFLANSFLDKISLNSIQKDAVCYDEGPQLVFAGAGTGKTRVLTAKIAWLIQNKNIYPNQIFAATFTNKAAREMQKRVEDLTSIPCYGLWIGTFHSLCARILRKEAEKIGYNSFFSIYDEADQISCIKKVAKSFNIDERNMSPKMLISKISKYKNYCIPPKQLAGHGQNYYEELVINAYSEYQKMLFKQNAMDFDDLITNCVYLFRENNDVAEYYQSLFKYILVDEYQDTNLAQFYLIEILSKKHKNIFVVGDDDQSIYTWRGARLENILTFEKKFPNTKVFKLEQNYRSTKGILDFANAVISGNKIRASKRLWTTQKGENDVTIVRYRNDQSEAESVTDCVSELIKNGVNPGNIAILFRTNAQSRLFEDSMRKRQIRYVLVGGISFYERKEIKDCLAYLRLCVNKKDDASCERILNVPPRSIGDKCREILIKKSKQKQKSLLETILEESDLSDYGRGQNGILEIKKLFSSIYAFQEKNISPYKILKFILTETGYITMYEEDDTEESQSRIENINELLNALAIWEKDNISKGLLEFLEEISLSTDIDRYEQKDDCVSLLTLHSAKGLEFSHVFIVGCEDGILPSTLNIDKEEMIEEERRLLYVGITRAMKYLQISYTDSRWRFGNLLPMEKSRFLYDIPKEYYNYIDKSNLYLFEEDFNTKVIQSPHKEKNKLDKSDYNSNNYKNEEDFSQERIEYKIGQMVFHKSYGKGRIVNISGFGNDMKMTVLFNNGTRIRLMAKFAKLET